MDTVYLALDVFQWKTPSELGTEQNYAPPYIVAIPKYELQRRFQGEGGGGKGAIVPPEILRQKNFSI